MTESKISDGSQSEARIADVGDVMDAIDAQVSWLNDEGAYDGVPGPLTALLVVKKRLRRAVSDHRTAPAQLADEEIAYGAELCERLLSGETDVRCESCGDVATTSIANMVICGPCRQLAGDNGGQPYHTVVRPDQAPGITCEEVPASDGEDQP